MRRLSICLFVFCSLAALLAPALGSDEQLLERSVVRIVNYAQRGTWYTPWDLSGVGESSGTGFAIGNGLVMTNAHVVSDSRYLLIFVYNDPEPRQAEVVHIAHDADLALIRPVKRGALDDLPALEFGGMPALRTTVDTLGYPAGGMRLSSTRGVVSRIEEQLYVHSGKDLHLTVQTDAAINPGNSGGPVVQDGKVVGVAFQGNAGLENTGFFIPMEVIQRFLNDVQDGRYDGYPELGAETSGLENVAARAQAGMKTDETGVRVDSVYRGSSAENGLEAGDVILEVENRTVANDGTVDDGGGRISYGLLVDRKQIGESVPIRLLRDGRRIEVDVPLTSFPMGDAHGHAYDRLPRYYIYGGLVFVPLNLEMLKTFGGDWHVKADKEIVYEFLVRPMIQPELIQQERVVLLRRLKHPVNSDMAFYRNQVVEKVNGKTITCLEDLVETLENHQGDFHLIEFSNRRRIGVINRLDADAAHREILGRYGIQEDRNL
ncbi:MAG: trypsin-like peptidase domain-containing protein [Acidobacteria bacterium]|uniref:Trypsin-like peptidase domain-containing protein n=1 Tax=Candidatus Polarisedimenticola svalbardensis TaxID=2886004 RepID=A0A8J7C2E8_9BACT|nr:trypsin-like peptidase domain-containing protein [Candidatus Polarisedimenticola svalbardensis]